MQLEKFLDQKPEYHLEWPKMSSVSGSVGTSEAASRGVVYGASSTSNLSYEGSNYSAASASAHVSKELRDVTTLIQVQKKLRKHKDYKDLSGAELVEKVTELVDVKTILCTFSHLVEHKLLDEVEKLAESNDNPDQFAAENTEEIQLAKASQKSRYIQVANIPLKLYVR